MNLRREPPPPPQTDPPSVQLMRAIAGRPWGRLQGMEGGEPITDLDAVAMICGRPLVDIAVLVEVGIVAGYLVDDDLGAVGLSAKGQRWYERDLGVRY